jgi:hypothetical protein
LKSDQKERNGEEAKGMEIVLREEVMKRMAELLLIERK